MRKAARRSRLWLRGDDFQQLDGGEAVAVDEGRPSEGDAGLGQFKQTAEIRAWDDAIERRELHLAQYIVVDQHASQRSGLTDDFGPDLVVHESQIEAGNAEQHWQAIGLAAEDYFSPVIVAALFCGEHLNADGALMALLDRNGHVLVMRQESTVDFGG